jgi:hypothetical protein
MKSELITLIGLMISTVLLVYLWQISGKLRLPPPGFGKIIHRLRTKSWIGSADTIKNEESENPIRYLPPNLSGIEILGLRLCLMILYVLVVFIIIVK